MAVLGALGVPLGPELVAEGLAVYSLLAVALFRPLLAKTPFRSYTAGMLDRSRL